MIHIDSKASKRQVAFIRELASERNLAENARERLLRKLDSELISFSDARDNIIPWLLRQTVKSGVVPSHIQAMPRQAKSESLAAEDQRSQRQRSHRDPSTLPTSGVFRKDGETYVIVPSRRNPGRHYAMRMVETPNRLTPSGEVVNFDYVKDPGAIWQLYEEHRLPAEAVEALVVQHKVCIYPGCNRVLRAAKSVAAGVGKRHAEKLGIPWGGKRK